jgi:hypothetical protein
MQRSVIEIVPADGTSAANYSKREMLQFSLYEQP